MAARLLAALLLSCLLLCVCAEPRVARCAVDANVKVPLSGVIAASQAEWIPQLSGWTISVPWSKIEAKKGQYNFGPIDDQLTYADNSDGYGLQGVNIEITTGDFVPGWLLTSTDFGLVSAYWTAAYQQAYRDLTAALAARYDGHALVRGVVLSACTASAAVSQASLHAGFTELAAAQCYYSAMLSHVAYWVNTPTILRLPCAVDDTFHRIVQDFRAYFGPRLGVLSITQDLANAPNADLFDMLKHHVGANVVDFTGAPASDAAVDGLFSLASASRATGITLPARWNAVGAAFIAQWQLDGVRKTLAALPVDCAFAPSRAALSQSAASVPSAAWDMQILLSPDAPLSASKIMGVVAAVTGLPSSRFQLAKAGTWQRMLGMRGFVYDQPFAVPAAIVARYLGKLTAAQWRSAGLEARSLGYEENLNKSSDDGLDGLYIFLIVLASVIYLCVFALFCYLMAVIIRYCVSGERGNATMATISSAGNRVRGWVRFNDQDAGFPATFTPAHSKEGAATPSGDAV